MHVNHHITKQNSTLSADAFQIRRKSPLVAWRSC